MLVLEIIYIFIGTLLAAAFIVAPIIIITLWPIIMREIYRLACYMTDGSQLYDENGEFISKEELRKRTKISKTVIETLTNHGSLNNMSDENQLSLF